VLSADTNIFVHAADPDSPQHAKARNFFEALERSNEEFVLCELVLVELYMLLRNPAVFARPYTSSESAGYCRALRQNPSWRCIDYDPEVSKNLWQYASTTKSGYRHIIDARLAYTLQHHGVDRFATVNQKDFKEFGFKEVWNPLVPEV
jgi:toxin-antitoxin system PIN domain toxin